MSGLEEKVIGGSYMIFFVFFVSAVVVLKSHLYRLLALGYSFQLGDLSQRVSTQLVLMRPQLMYYQFSFVISCIC